MTRPFLLRLIPARRPSSCACSRGHVAARRPGRGHAVAERTITGVVVRRRIAAPIAGAEVTRRRHPTPPPTPRAASRARCRPARSRSSGHGRPATSPLAIDTRVTRAADVTRRELALARDARFATTVDVVARRPPPRRPRRPCSRCRCCARRARSTTSTARCRRCRAWPPTEEFGSRLAVRGGSPDQNLTMMDGVEIHDPYRLFGLTSAFNPETIQRFELATGGFSVKYGDRLSSLLAVENRDGRTRQRPGRLGVAQHHRRQRGARGRRCPSGARGSWLVTGRRTYYDLVAARITDNDVPRLCRPAGARQSGTPSAGSASHAVRAAQPAVGGAGDRRGRRPRRVPGRHRERPGVGCASTRRSGAAASRTPWSASPTRARRSASTPRSRTRASDRMRPATKRSASPTSCSSARSACATCRSRQELAWSLGPHVLDIGGEVHRLSTPQRFEITGDRNPVAANGSSVQGGAGLPDLLESSARAIARRRLAAGHVAGRRAGLACRPGCALDHAGVTGENELSPRLSAPLALGAGHAPDCGGRPLHAEPRLREAGAERLRARLHERGGDRRAAQRTGVAGVGGRGARTRPGLTAARSRATTSASPTCSSAVSNPTAERLRASGALRLPGRAAVGASPPIRSSPPCRPTTAVAARTASTCSSRAPARRREARLTGWASYTWGKAERDAYGRRYPFEYDRRHAFTMVSSLRFTPRWELAATTRVASGFPRTAPLGVRVAGREDDDRPRRRRRHRRDPAGRDAAGLLVYAVDFGGVGNLNHARLPLFARVDARLTWRPRGAAGRWELYAEVINVLDRQNAGALDPRLAYDPASDRPRIVEQRDQAIPRLPTLGVRFRFWTPGQLLGPRGCGSRAGLGLIGTCGTCASSPIRRSPARCCRPTCSSPRCTSTRRSRWRCRRSGHWPWPLGLAYGANALVVFYALSCCARWRRCRCCRRAG